MAGEADEEADSATLVVDADSVAETDNVVEGSAELVTTINVGSADKDVGELLIDRGADAAGGVEASKHFCMEQPMKSQSPYEHRPLRKNLTLNISFSRLKTSKLAV